MKQLFSFLLLLAFVAASHAQQWTRQYDFVDDCICGLAKASKDGKFGFVDKNGKLIVPLEYEDALSFNEGYTAVKKNGKWGYIDSTGKVIAAPQFEDALAFREGVAAVKKNGKYGFVNVQMDAVIPFEYDMARGFAEGLAPVSNSKGLWGYIDKSGKMMIGYMYNFADLFTNGRARVMKNGVLMMIDQHGNKVEEQE